MTSPTLSVTFPSTESPGTSVGAPSPSPSSPPRRQHLLSFRRISLPTAPTLLNRRSSASLASFDSFPEENGEPENRSPTHTPVKNAVRRGLQRPFTLDASKKARKRRDSTKQPDESKLVRRRKIIEEFYDTERAYVQGLNLIYSHFLTPIIESLDSPSPLLGREDLTTVFSNFIDIWNLHRSFYTSLSDLLSPSLSQPHVSPPPLSPVLVSHFPYLSLYTPFITSFPAVLAKLKSLSEADPNFDRFIKRQESDERCGKLKLRDWLLTIVQRCPRYLLLLKDVINCTDTEDQEHANLMAAHALLSKVTNSLDTSLHTHAQTLSLLALQRATPNLPIQLISPGRTLLKRGVMTQLDNSSILKEREFILFTDCLIWFANDKMGEAEWMRRSDALSIGNLFPVVSAGKRPEFIRSRSKSENELPVMSNAVRRPVLGSPKKSTPNSAPTTEENWWFIGKTDLVDVEVVGSSSRDPGDESRLEILSPAMSFAVYAQSEEDRDDWVSSIRGAKASLLVSLHVIHPNSTLASSSSTNHLRRSLQAVPYLPEEDERNKLPKRGKVDHFVPAIWVPDGKTDTCMRCNRAFGWRRRRHHCRLCGRCVCAMCSGKTFFISNLAAKDPSKSARACNACYDAVFPVIEPSGSEGNFHQAYSGSTLSSFPSWKTQKVTSPDVPKPSELMAFDGPTRLSSSPDKKQEVQPRVLGARRTKARPLSHPSIPQAFQGSKTGEFLSVPTETLDEEDGQTTGDASSPIPSAPGSVPASPSSIDDVSPRTRKRFSMPAIALQTTAVTTHPNSTGEGRSKRFSLVLGGRHKVSTHIVESHDLHGEGSNSESGGLGRGAAAARLLELLERTKSTDY